MSEYKLLLSSLCFTIIVACFGFSLKAQDTSFKDLEEWSDSAYIRYQTKFELDHDQIDSVMFLYPPGKLSEGKEKLYRILASHYHNIGKPTYAFPYLIEIEKNVRQRGDSARLSIILAGISEAYRAFGDVDQALPYAQEAVSLAERNGSDLHKGYSYGRLATIYFDKNPKDSFKILPMFRKAIQHYEAIEDYNEVGNYMGDYANVLYANGKHQEAIDMLLMAQDHIKDSVNLCHVRNVLSSIYNQIGESSLAIQYASKSFKIANAHGKSTYAFEASKELQKAYDSLGDIKNAYRWSLVNNELMFDYFDQSKGTDVRIVQLESERKTQDLENQMLRQKMKQDGALSSMNQKLLIFTIVFTILLGFLAFFLNRQRASLSNAHKLLAEKNNEIEAKNKELHEFVEVRNKLISVASHDLRSPLVTLKNLLEVFKEEDLTKEEFKQAAILMEKQYERSLDMADNLLLWVKSQLMGIEAKNETFNLADLTKEIIEYFEPLMTSADKTFKFESNTMVEVSCDYEMIKFVLRNIIHNAIKFTPAQGKVSIRINEYAKKVEWVIQDEGPGMTSKQIDNIFNVKNKQLDQNTRTGAGIGLFLSSYFAKANNCEISVDSIVNRGTVITIDIPKN